MSRLAARGADSGVLFSLHTALQSPDTTTVASMHHERQQGCKSLTMHLSLACIVRDEQGCPRELTTLRLDCMQLCTYKCIHGHHTAFVYICGYKTRCLLGCTRVAGDRGRINMP